MRARKKVRHRPWGPDSQRAYTANAVSKARREAQPALRQFWGWLDHDRCLSPGTITVRVSSARSLVDALCTREPLKQTLARWTAVDVEDFFVRYCRNHGPAARRSMQAALRLFLRFAAAEGWASTELVHAVPSLRTYGLSGVPRGLAESDVDRLLRSLGGNDVSARDRAIVLLLVVYGIRRGQICALRLEDLDWRERRITFRAHKGGKAIQHELIPPVADTIAMYLRHERPACADATVFLRAKKPYQALRA